MSCWLRKERLHCALSTDRVVAWTSSFTYLSMQNLKGDAAETGVDWGKQIMLASVCTFQHFTCSTDQYLWCQCVCTCGCP